MTRHEASCSCGQLRLVALGDPIRVSVCHCLACQRRTGSTYGVQARWKDEDVTIAGASNEWVRIGDEGGRSRYHFCGTCGATVWYRLDDDPGVTAVPVGAFADPGFPAPTRSVYEARRHPWVSVPDDAEHWN